MTDVKMLRDIIDKSGYKKSYIASKCGITYPAFLNRINGKIEFRANEVRVLQELLDISVDDVVKIFFTQKDDKTSTL